MASCSVYIIEMNVRFWKVSHLVSIIYMNFKFQMVSCLV